MTLSDGAKEAIENTVKDLLSGRKKVNQTSKSETTPADNKRVVLTVLPLEIDKIKKIKS